MNLFKEHFEIIKKNGYEIVPKITKKKNQIMITFDDGFKGLYDNFGFFIQNKIYVKLFLIVDYMKRDNYMNLDQVKELIDTGFLSIDSHTVGHKSLDVLSLEEINYQLKKSKKELEKMFEIDIEGICYPRGKFSFEVIEESQKIGYKKQYSCLPGSYYNQIFENVYNRSLVQDVSAKEFECILNGADKIFYKRYFKQQFKDSNVS
jgi:peptidoglycan/xylan/chitin deacetylase (PgdA/CDA1 family)